MEGRREGWWLLDSVKKLTGGKERKKSGGEKCKKPQSRDRFVH